MERRFDCSRETEEVRWGGPHAGFWGVTPLFCPLWWAEWGFGGVPGVFWTSPHHFHAGFVGKMGFPTYFGASPTVLTPFPASLAALWVVSPYFLAQRWVPQSVWGPLSCVGSVGDAQCRPPRQVFERGLQSIPLSMDLWIHYISYLQSTLDMNLPESIQKIRG